MSTIIYLEDARGRDDLDALPSVSKELAAFLELLDKAQRGIDGLRIIALTAQAGLPLSDHHADLAIDRWDLAATRVETQWAKLVAAIREGTP
jgi:hypothetical protein